MTSLPPYFQPDETATPDTDVVTDAQLPWHRRIPKPTVMTIVAALLGQFFTLSYQEQTVVNGTVTEFIHIDFFNYVAAALLLVAFLWTLLRRRGSDAADRAPVWAIAVGAAGVAFGVYLALTAQSGLDEVNAFLAR